MYTTSKNVVACRPFPEKIAKTDKKMGLAFGNQTISMVELEVVADCTNPVGLDDISVGDKVLVKPDRIIQPWAKEVCKASGIEGDFILVPTNEIFLVLKK